MNFDKLFCIFLSLFTSGYTVSKSESGETKKRSLVLTRLLLLVVVGGSPLERVLGDTVSVTVHGIPDEAETQGPGRPHTETVDVKETFSGSFRLLRTSFLSVPFLTGKFLAFVGPSERWWNWGGPGTSSRR